MKGLQERNIGSHHLGSRGYGGKRSKWAKEDVEAASLGIPDPLAEFIVPHERDVLRARHRARVHTTVEYPSGVVSICSTPG